MDDYSKPGNSPNPPKEGSAASNAELDHLRDPKLNLELAIKAANIGFWSWDLRSNACYFSPEWKAQLGYDDQEIEHHFDSWASRLHADDRERTIQAAQDYLDNKLANYEEEFRLRHRDGSFRWILAHARAKRDSNGKPLMMFGSHVDITQRKLHEQAIWKNEERLSLVLRATNDGIWDCDLTNGTVWWNEAYDTLYGTRPSDTTKSWQWWIDHIHPADRDRVADSLKSVVESSGEYGDKWTEEYRYKRIDGDYAFVADKAYVARDSTGKATRILGAMQDVTTQKQAEEALHQANDTLELNVAERTKELKLANQQLKETIEDLKRTDQQLHQQETQLAHVARLNIMGEMVGGIAHEVNQPLFAISSFASACELELEQRESENNENLIQMNRQIAEQAVHAGEILRRLRSFVEKSETIRALLDMNDLIQESLDLTSSQVQRFQATVNLELAGDLPQIIGDKIQIQQTIVNLFLNAFESMDTKPTDERQVTVRTELSGDSVDVCVEDCGRGLSTESSDKIFDAFFTTKADGMGLGLAISRSIVEAHGGKIWATSESNRGTTFRFRLPSSES